MAKFCGTKGIDCHDICDYCIHYHDDSEGLKKKFVGVGTCDVSNKNTNACDGADCDDFECRNVSKKV